MAWIEVHQSLPSHRKTSKLMRELGVKTRAQAVGHLVMLWLWALDNAPTGNLRELDPDDVADAAGWSGPGLRAGSRLHHRPPFPCAPFGVGETRSEMAEG